MAGPMQTQALTGSTTASGMVPISRLRTVLDSVCLIVRGDVHVGTGFLVAPGVLLTAAHLFQNPDYGQEGQKEYLHPKHFTAVFHYEGPGSKTKCIPVEDLLFWSPCGDPDDYTDPTRLDCCVLAVNAAGYTNLLSGTNYIGSQIDTQCQQLEAGSVVIVVGHPGGDVKSWSANSISADQVPADPHSMALFHSVDTLGGSSGSPLLDGNLNAIGVHVGAKEHNIALSMATILNALDSDTEAAKRIEDWILDQIQLFEGKTALTKQAFLDYLRELARRSQSQQQQSQSSRCWIM